MTNTLEAQTAAAIAAVGERQVFCRACRTWQRLHDYWTHHQVHFAPCVFCGKDTIALWVAHPTCEQRQADLERRLSWCGADLVCWTDDAAAYGGDGRQA